MTGFALKSQLTLAQHPEVGAHHEVIYNDVEGPAHHREVAALQEIRLLPPVTTVQLQGVPSGLRPELIGLTLNIWLFYCLLEMMEI